MRKTLIYSTALLFSSWPMLSVGQLPERLENCLPIPTFAQEVREMQPEQSEPAPKVVQFKNVHLNSSKPLAVSDEQVLSELKTEPQIVDNRRWPQEAITIIEDALKSRGYFKAIVREPVVETVTESKQQKVVNMTVQVDPGLQYRLSAIRFARATQFDAKRLRAFFPVQQGEIFNTHRIGRGMEVLRRAYGEKGFVNFTAVPYLDFDDQNGTIALTWDLEEGKQFRVANFAVLGLEPALSSKLIEESGLRPGNIFNAKLLDDFFNRNKSVLPKDANTEEDVTRTLDERAGTINLTLDFRRCP